MKILIENQKAKSFVSDDHDGFTVNVINPLKLDKYSPPILANLIDRDHGPQEAAKFRIKNEAAKRIEDLQWRIERANERDSIGAEGETIGDVLREREAIRRASNRAESYIGSLENPNEARQYQFDVLPSDWPDNPIRTRLTFMRRFTDSERQAIRAARDSEQSQDLLDFWELLQIATYVNINDADIQAGVQMLEQNGLISEGRSDEILDVST